MRAAAAGAEAAAGDAAEAAASVAAAAQDRSASLPAAAYDLEYWQRRYAHDGAPFEWYTGLEQRGGVGGDEASPLLEARAMLLDIVTCAARKQASR